MLTSPTQSSGNPARVERTSTTITHALAAASDACATWGVKPRGARLRFEIERDVEPAWVLRVRVEHEQGSAAVVTARFIELQAAVALLDEVGRALADWAPQARLWRVVTTLLDMEGRGERHDRRVWARDENEAELLAPVVVAQQITPVAESTRVYAMPRAAGVR